MQTWAFKSNTHFSLHFLSNYSFFVLGLLKIELNCETKGIYLLDCELPESSVDVSFI